MKVTLLPQVLLLLIFGSAAQGASFTSIRAGMWSDPGTWGGNAVPGVGDTVIIRHFVTVHSDTTVGTSPYETTPTTTPAIDVQDTSTPGYDGHLTVLDGARLTVRGNMKMTSTGTTHQAKLTVQPGGTFVFDNTQAPSARYRIYPNANGAHSQITFGSPGVTAPRAVFRGKPEGTDGLNSSFIHSGPEMYSWAATSIYGTDIYDCGTSSEPCIRTYEYNSNTAPVMIWDTDLVRTGGIELKAAGSNTAARSTTWILRRVRTFLTSNSSRSIHFSTPAAIAAGGKREVTSCFFDQGINQSTLGQFEITNTVFARNFYSHGINIVPSPFYWTKFENNFVHMTKAHASGSAIWGDMKDIFFIQESGVSNTNPHGYWPHSSLRRDITIDGVIGEYTHVAGLVNEAGTGAAEGEFLGAGACSFNDEFTHTIKNSIVLPNSSGLTLGNRNSPSYLFVGLNMGNGVQTPQCRVELLHNTIMGGLSEAGSGIMFGEGTTDPPPHSFDAIKSNLYWDVTPRSTLVHHLGGPNTAGLSRVDIATPSGITHNANFNYVPASGFSAPNDKCNGTPYRMACSEAPGWNDLNDQDPRFIDPTRNFEKWGQVMHGADGTVAGSLGVLAATPATELGARITEMLAFTREGFMPQNEAYRSAGHDGTTIGAVQMTLPSSGSGTRFDTTLGNTCVYAISPAEVTMTAAGGVAAVTVTASDSTCQWVAGAGFSWGLTLNGPTVRTGSATLQYTFAPNSEHARSSNVTIADISIPFTQDGNATPPAANCTYVISPMQVEIPASGGFAAVTVTASAQTCQWLADVGTSWGFTLEGPALITGSATLQYSVGPNLGAARNAYVSIGGTSIPVTQYGTPAPPPDPTHCTYVVSPMQVEMPAAGGSASVTVTASDPTCQWVAEAGLSWGVLNGPTVRTGSATLQYTFNPSTGDRKSGYVEIAGTSILFTQEEPVTSTPVIHEAYASIPKVESLSPMTGVGSGGTFTATFSHAAGATQLYLGYVLFLPTPNVVSYNAKASCLIEYNRISNGMRLIDDAGTGWLGPISGVVVGPQSGTMSNSQCTVDISRTSVVISANTMTVRVPVAFKNTLTSRVATFLQAVDVDNAWTGMTQFGSWSLPNAALRPGPSITAVSSSTNSGSHVQYSVKSSHSSGTSWLGMINLLVSTAIVGGGHCHVVYFPGSKQVNLVNDDGSGLVLESGITAGLPGTIANSRCAIDTGRVAESIQGTSLTVNVPLSFFAAFHGPKNVYVNTFDIAGHLTHWVQVAALNVQ